MNLFTIVLLIWVFNEVLSIQTADFPLFYQMKGGEINAFECNVEDTIYELKNRLKDLIGLVEGFHLSVSFAGKELIDDKQSLADASICAESRIDVEKVFPNGYYQFITADYSRTLDARRPIISLQHHYDQYDDNDHYHAQRYLFLVKRQSCGHYTIQSNATGFFWKIKELERLSYLVLGYYDTHLFDFIHHADDVWFIQIQNSSKMLTVSPTQTMIIPKVPFNITHPEIGRQLFHCRKSKYAPSEKEIIDVHDCGRPFADIEMDEELANSFITFLKISLLLLVLSQARFIFN